MGFFILNAIATMVLNTEILCSTYFLIICLSGVMDWSVERRK